MLDKWVVKYMKLAKVLADENTACYSRKIGVVLVSEDNCVIQTGYNGSISKAPHNDSYEYLDNLWENILTNEEKYKLVSMHNLHCGGQQFFVAEGAVRTNHCNLTIAKQDFLSRFVDQKICPRKLLSIPSGECLELCNCGHAERNCLALANKTGVSTKNSSMFCYCGCPCHECTIQIIQAGVKKVICLETSGPDYSRSSRSNFKMSGVELIQIKPEELNTI